MLPAEINEEGAHAEMHVRRSVPVNHPGLHFPEVSTTPIGLAAEATTGGSVHARLSSSRCKFGNSIIDVGCPT